MQFGPHSGIHEGLDLTKIINIIKKIITITHRLFWICFLPVSAAYYFLLASLEQINPTLTIIIHLLHLISLIINLIHFSLHLTLKLVLIQHQILRQALKVIHNLPNLFIIHLLLLTLSLIIIRLALLHPHYLLHLLHLLHLRCGLNHFIPLTIVISLPPSF